VKLQNCHGNISCLLSQDGVRKSYGIKKAAENSNTQKNTINWVRVVDKWCDENGLQNKLEMILPEQLNKVLKRFYASVCKQDGTDEPGSLKVVQAVLDGHLKGKSCSFSITKDRENFLRERCKSLTGEEEKALWEIHPHGHS